MKIHPEEFFINSTNTLLAHRWSKTQESLFSSLYHSRLKGIAQKIKFLIPHRMFRLPLLVSATIHNPRFLSIDFQFACLKTFFYVLQDKKSFCNIVAVYHNIISIAFKFKVRILPCHPFIK